MGILDATRSIRRQGVPRGVNRHSKLARSRYLGKIKTGVKLTTNAMAEVRYYLYDTIINLFSSSLNVSTPHRIWTWIFGYREKEKRARRN
jgi:hypothetical protein